jgi:VWFA-related protein
MTTHSVHTFLTVCSVLLIDVSLVIAQTVQPTTAPEPQEDVLRVNTELVQTDVMVFDKQGKFVDGLRKQDFELSIDGKPREISFFDRVAAGSRNEDAQLAAARGQAPKDSTSGAVVPFDRGRTVFFFVDDLHLATNDLNSARNVLSHYVGSEMGQNDSAAIISATGQIGFLQQITGNKDVLHAAVVRLKPHAPLVRDAERPPMSEYQALAIERNNRDVINYFVEELMKDLPTLPQRAASIGGLPTTRAEQQVRDRAHLILQQAAAISTSMLSAFESLVRFAGRLPGRKLVFFISDGFFLDLRNSDSLDRLRHITSAAAHNGVVIYSVDARGLTTGALDASSEAAPDPGGRLQRIAGGELIESQDAMNSLALDTGGRTIFNTNALDAGINKALIETSKYYLLAWRPDNDEQKNEKFRTLMVTVVGHPELTVRMRPGFFNTDRPPAKLSKADEQRRVSAETTAESQLNSAMLGVVPEGRLPVSLSLTYVNTREQGSVLTIALLVKGSDLASAPSTDKDRGTITVAGLVFNDEGKVGAHFTDHLTFDKARSAPARTRDLVYSYPVTIPPGLYQVRVGLRDEADRAIGTAQDWIAIPDLAKAPLALSSLIITERLSATTEAAGSHDLAAEGQKDFSVDHRFHLNSGLQFFVFIYSPPSPAKPDVAVQMQILRDDQPVLTTSLRKVATEGIPDLTRLAYAAEISLEHLPAGRYLLRITAIDRVGKRTAAQETRFQIG